MNTSGPLAFDCDLSQLPTDRNERHEVFVDFFGRYMFWLRNWSLQGTRKLIDSVEAREKLGTIRCQCYEGIAQLPPEQRETAMHLVEETLNGFVERLSWCLGDEGTDSRIGSRHAYRFRVEMDIVDVETGEIVETEPINRGGKKFFGSYWGRWLNRFSSQKPK